MAFGQILGNVPGQTPLGSQHIAGELEQNPQTNPFQSAGPKFWHLCPSFSTRSHSLESKSELSPDSATSERDGRNQPTHKQEMRKIQILHSIFKMLFLIHLWISLEQQPWQISFHNHFYYFLTKKWNIHFLPTTVSLKLNNNYFQHRTSTPTMAIYNIHFVIKSLWQQL